MSSWFVLNFVDNSDNSANLTHFRVTRDEREFLWQPWIPYDPNALIETNLEFVALNHTNHFNDVYQGSQGFYFW